MVENYSSFIEYINKSHMNNYKLENILIYKIIIVYITIVLFQFIIYGKEKNKSYNFFKEIVSRITTLFCKNDFFKIKYESIFNRINKKRNNEISSNNVKIRNYGIKIPIRLIIIIFCLLKSNMLFGLSFLQNSSIITLKINGTGYNYILNNNFQNIYYVSEISINGKTQDVKSNNYLFNQTHNIVELKWNDYNIIDCSYMFYECSNITEIDLSKFNSKNVIYMHNMFDGCSSLISLDLSNFNTLQVKNMERMFSDCSSLTSLNLSNFDTSQVTDIRAMFYNCWLLTSLDLSNFDTSNVNYMDWMFYNCSSLTVLNLSNFNTSNVKYMARMFYKCSSLTSLDLSSFNISRVNNIQGMFYDCINLEYINLNNLDENNLLYTTYYDDNLFYNVPENVVICINIYNNKSKILSQIIKKNCYTIDCSNDWKSKQKKIIYDTNECIESCDKSSRYNYEYNSKCYECKCDLEECSTNLNISLIKGLCKKCNSNYFTLEEDQSKSDEYKHCYKEPEGYYLDNNIYRKCYEVCKTCNKSGNYKEHNCLECKPNYKFEIKYNDYINCYNECNYYYYFDEKNNFHCTNNFSCPKEYPKLNENTSECNKYNFENILEDLKENDIKNMSKEEEINYYDNFRKNIEKILTSSNFDDNVVKYVKLGKMSMTFSSLQNQQNNINNNMTSIDFGNCETLLRNDYNISINETIYINKIDMEQDGIKIPKVEYDIYCSLFGENLIKLNLTACSDSDILIYVPFKLNDNEDRYNKSSGYYNDICYTTTSEYGTDMILKDRRKFLNNGNNIICQEDCEFSKYNTESLKAECTCKVKESSSSFVDMNINTTKLFENFKDLKSFININFLVCYKKLLNISGIMNNIGCYILTAIIAFHLITMIIFGISQFPLIKMKIKDITFAINESQSVKNKEANKNKGAIRRKINYQKKNLDNNSDKNKMIASEYINKRPKIKKKSVQLLQRPKLLTNNINISNINNNKIIHNKIIKRSSKNILATKNNNNINFNNNNKQEKIKNIMKYIDEEINLLSYNLALIHDKRSYCQYYLSLLRTKHNLIFALFNNSDYNSCIIKIDLFFIGFTIDYIVNALFYNDETMHNIHENRGQFDIEAQISIIVYSSLISTIISTPLNLLALSNNSIINFKQNKSRINLNKRAEDLKSKLTTKFIFYFIISFLVLIIFWYYISMFGVIYRNTQLHLLKDTLMSFGLSLFIPFVIYLLPGFFRIPALSNKKNKRECLYNFSKFLQIF